MGSQIDSDLFVSGTLGCRTFNPPAGSVPDNAISGILQATRLENQKTISLDQGAENTALIAPLNQWVHSFRATGTIKAFRAAIAVSATDPSRVITIDLQKGSMGSPFTTVLSAPIQILNTTLPRQLVSGIIAVPAAVAGDILRVVVTATGALGVAAIGLTTFTTIREQPD